MANNNPAGIPIIGGTTSIKRFAAAVLSVAAVLFAVCFVDNAQAAYADNTRTGQEAVQGTAVRKPVRIGASHAYAVEYSTGRILYDQDGTKPAGIASMTKIITLYLVYKAIAQGGLTWDTRIHISDYSYQLSRNWETTTVPMDKRDYTVRQLVTAAFTRSANSAAVSLAEKIAGSEPKFVDQMKTLLKGWGITDARLYNSSGLNNSYLGDNIYPGSAHDAENMMSARSIAIATWHFMHDYPDVLEMTKNGTAEFDGMSLKSTNHMLPGQEDEYSGVDGFKTGTTQIAGECFTATAVRNGMRVIAVVQHADQPQQTASEGRFAAMKTLLDYCFADFSLTVAVKKDESYNGSYVAVDGGTERQAKAVAVRDLTVCLSAQERKLLSSVGKASSAQQTGEKTGILLFEPLKDTVAAPVAKGMKLGTVSASNAQGYLGTAGIPSVDMVAEKGISQRQHDWWGTATRAVSRWWGSMVRTVSGWWDSFARWVSSVWRR